MRPPGRLATRTSRLNVGHWWNPAPSVFPPRRGSESQDGSGNTAERLEFRFYGIACVTALPIRGPEGGVNCPDRNSPAVGITARSVPSRDRGCIVVSLHGEPLVRRRSAEGHRSLRRAL